MSLMGENMKREENNGEYVEEKEKGKGRIEKRGKYVYAKGGK